MERRDDLEALPLYITSQMRTPRPPKKPCAIKKLTDVEFALISLLQNGLTLPHLVYIWDNQPTAEAEVVMAATAAAAEVEVGVATEAVTVGETEVMAAAGAVMAAGHPLLITVLDHDGTTDQDLDPTLLVVIESHFGDIRTEVEYQKYSKQYITTYTFS